MGRGGLVISHDIALLELMDDTAELHDGRLTVVGGPYRAYREHVEIEQAAARQDELAAEQIVRREQRQRTDAETVLARRQCYARTDHDNKRKPKAVMNQSQNRGAGLGRQAARRSRRRCRPARTALEAARARVRDDTHIHLELPDPDVPACRRLAALHGADRTVVIQGPERVALTGSNGVGKTTLLEALVHPERPRPGHVICAGATAHTDRIGYLPQRGDGLDEAASVLEAVRGAAPDRPTQQVRHCLARFLLSADTVERPVGSLSGGERFRVALARILVTDPPPQLLVLDEPTNDLDTHTVDHLVSALAGYRGAVLIASHDDTFLGRLRLTTRLELHHDGRLQERAATNG